MKPSRVSLTLYVTGQTPRSQRAIDAVKSICAQQPPEVCEVTIVDVLERPQAAEDDKILATPTLIRTLPPPSRRLIGDLSDYQRVMAELDLPLPVQASDGQMATYNS